ncbi:MAG: hypothetical protein ACHWZW_05490 [Spirulina sp.]
MATFLLRLWAPPDAVFEETGHGLEVPDFKPSEAVADLGHSAVAQGQDGSRSASRRETAA